MSDEIYKAIKELPSISKTIKEYNLIAKKKLSQNFILDINLTNKIAKLSDSIKNNTVIEIGAGPGSLTRSILLNGAKKIIIIEKDDRFIGALTKLNLASKNKTENIKSCDELTELSKIYGNKRGKYLGKILLKNLPKYFIEELKNLNVNQPSKPIVADDGIYVTMICNYNKDLNQEYALKEMIKDNIRNRSTIILKERYLLDLNRKALIDVRI